MSKKSDVGNGKTLLKGRIKELEESIEKLKGENDTRLQSIQSLQQQIAQVNSIILRNMGAKEEIERQLKNN